MPESDAPRGGGARSRAPNRPAARTPPKGSATPARRPRQAPPPPPPRNRWVVTVAVVSAAAGAFLLLGATMAAAIHHFDPHVPNGVVYATYVLGAVGGVWVGAYLAGRLTGGNRRRFVAAGLGGVLGLVVAVFLPFVNAPGLSLLLPILAILMPGIGAWAGSVIAMRRGPTGA